MNPSTDITRATLSVLFICALIASCLWIMRPFLSSLVWAVMIVVATWPVMLKVQAGLRGKRSLAVLAMTMMLLLVLVIPFSLAVATLLARSGEIIAWLKSLQTAVIPPPPLWAAKIPLVGQAFVARWHDVASSGVQELYRLGAPYAGKAVAWFAAQAGNASMVVLHFLLTVLIAAVLYMKGEKAAAGVLSFARRLAGRHGEDVAIMSAKAVRGVALGVVVTALIQSALGGVGLLIARVPVPLLLSAVMLILCIAQIGPGLVLIPSVIWLFWTGENFWGASLIVWTIFVGTIDNFIRPVLIKKGADLPLLLIFAGVIGGLIAFGIIGLFIGPVILAVTYTLLSAWVGEGGKAHHQPSPAKDNQEVKDQT